MFPSAPRQGLRTYENICTKCNPSALKKGELRNVETDTPSLYVGETARSIQERAVEHWGAVRRGDSSKSHMLKHQAMEHAGEPPQFVFKIVGQHKAALNRQIREAVRIRRRGGRHKSSTQEENLIAATYPDWWSGRRMKRARGGRQQRERQRTRNDWRR